MGRSRLHTNGFDEALALPTEQAARIALRTQQILAHESGVAETVDPLAGSYYVESLTNEIERRAEEYLTTIARFDLGGKYGMLRAIEQGYVQREIQNAAYAYQRAVDEKSAIVVGVNEFVSEREAAVPIQRIDEALEQRQVERVKELRVRRDAGGSCGCTEGCGGCGSRWGEPDAADCGRSGERMRPWARLRMCCAGCLGSIGRR